MSAVIHHKCNNQECDFKTTSSMNFPIWKSDSPKEMQKIPVGIRFKDYVAGYVNKQYCTVCKTAQPYILGSSMYLIYNTESLYIEDGSICPKCNKGVIEEDEIKRLWF